MSGPRQDTKSDQPAESTQHGASKVQESADRLLPLVETALVLQARCACARTTALRTGRRDKHGMGWRRMRRGGGTADAGLHTRDTHETKDDSARFKHASRLSSHVVCTRARADNSHGKASEGDRRSLAVTVPYRPAKVWRDEGCYCAGCAMRWEATVAKAVYCRSRWQPHRPTNWRAGHSRTAKFKKPVEAIRALPH